MIRLTRKQSEQLNRVALWLLCGTKLNPLQLSNFLQMGVVSTDGSLNICIAKYVQTASVSYMVTIDSPYMNLSLPCLTIPSPTP